MLRGRLLSPLRGCERIRPDDDPRLAPWARSFCPLGLLIGYLIVHNINTLHAWLGTALHVQVWDPEVYAFDTIPNTLEPFRVAWILGIAVVASIIGALVPAIRAARLNPVEALRWE